ncbi:GtrA family protein [Cryobacterium sp. M96]|uniref:GtrA family protein n=1 Tax=Cryobacterium sp. M96 TaxID=2048295 RepID=UPI001E5093DF|nr:GtrA family protein [Cryobacterium sp. M96]
MTSRQLMDHAKRGSAFLVIGGAAFLIDAGVFNALVYWGERGPMFEWPLTAKIIAIVAASVATYVGNHLWTFRDRKTKTSARNILAFIAINGVAILVQLGCLAFSRYVLGLADPVSDNISGTIVGQILATVLRYFSYNVWVFPKNPDLSPA